MKIQKKVIKKIIMFTLLLLFFSGSISFSQTGVSANTSDYVDLRFIFTTDLHGRLTTTDYELGKEYHVGSLAKAYTLIQEARDEKRKNNSFTFDVGDSLYDYTTENIYEMDKKAIQPIFKAMETIGYDAIVLGNHEFDYGYDYIMNQMKGTSLGDICVISNLRDVRTGKTAFHENMIITRKITTKNKKEITLKVGIIGETVPVLSKKRENYTGIFETEDIIANATKQAKQLKKAGADIIVVLSHSGFGTENPTEFSKDASYALTKIEEVDIVLCGHDHKVFPSTEKDSASFYKLSGVDKDTNLVNGKNLVMASNNGKSIGVVDLSLKITGSKKEIVKRNSEVRNVKTTTYADPTINDAFDEWEDIFLKASKNIVGQVKSGFSLNNFLGMIKDTNTIQLLNNAKINYALQSIYTQNKSYINYPVIAASNHSRYGQLSNEDFANITGKITEANLSAIAPFNKYLFLYEITGKELKEWLEWSASAYETTTKKVVWADETMNSVIQSTNLKSILSEEWLDEWNNFYIFDGVEYTINPSFEPRYNYYGTKINESNRIYNLKYNGMNVTDTMKFVLATESLTGTKNQVLKTLENKAIQKGINKTLSVLVDYIKDQGVIGKLTPFYDNNWRLTLPVDDQFILKLSENAELDKNEKDWNYQFITNINQYSYYKVSLRNNEKDIDPPNLVLASTNKENTNQDIIVAVASTDSSGIKTLKYDYGNYTIDNHDWQYAKDLEDNSFTATMNGIYTVYAEDTLGNKTVSKINISNINRDVLQIPYIKSYTNRMSKITGTAEPEAKIYFETVNGTYSDYVDADGTFSYQLPSQCAGDIVSVYVQDRLGRTSERLKVTVKRTGPNQPTMKNIDNTGAKIIGNTKDSVATVFAIVGSKVYVSKSGGETSYKKSELYKNSMNIIKTNVSIKSDGSYTIDVPPIYSDVLVKVYTVDHIGRASKVNSCRVLDVAPNIPTIYSVSDSDNKVYGHVYSKTPGTIYNVILTTLGQTYETVTDPKGYFSFEVGNMTIGQSLSVNATDIVDNVTRKSAVKTYSVKDVKSFVSKDLDKFIVLDQITDKSTIITGSCDRGNADILLKVNQEIIELSTDKYGKFEYDLLDTQKEGTQISVIIRKENGGIIESDVKYVEVGKPEKPILLDSDINNTTTLVRVMTKEKCSVTIEIGSNKYSWDKSYYDKELQGYVYEIPIKNVNSDTWVSIYATNSAGNSAKLEFTVELASPDSPTVLSIDTNTEVIKGKVMLVLQEKDKGILIPNVINTQTEVFAKIKNKIYTAVIKDDGTYEIKIPKQKANTTITVWAKNAAGNGPSKVVKVKKAKV